jgi:hypothetical protein
MTSRRRSQAALQRALRQAGDVAVAAPAVIAHRVARMALAGASPSARDRVEFHRMGSEKASAFAQAWTAMAWQWTLAAPMLAFRTWQTMLAQPGSGWAFGPATFWRQAEAWNAAALGAWSHGAAPIRRTAVANAKRLARTPLVAARRPS